jgi:putative glycerol-1-phosphate prenyltransferase
MNFLYNQLLENKTRGYKSFAVLLDPDKLDEESCIKLVNLGIESKIDYFFVGGSLLTNYNLTSILNIIIENSRIQVVLFPGS